MTEPIGGATAARPRPLWRRLLLLVAAMLIALVLLLTSGRPDVPTAGTVTAEQVGAGRAAVLQLPTSFGASHASSRIRYGKPELDGIGALVSHGFAPDRLALAIRGDRLVASASRPLVLGRWLNLQVTAQGAGKRFPLVHVRVGAVPLPAGLSRRLLEIARWVANRRGLDLPPLDRLVHTVSIRDGVVVATVRLPARDALVDRLNTLDSDPVDAVAVARLYCGLAVAQRRAPSDQLTTHLHRAFAGAAAQSYPAAYNRAAFVALAMLVVDPRVGDLAGNAQAATDRCRVPPVAVTIHGRADLPMHWALSAALSAGAGGQLARAMGEWKELADSLAKQSSFAVGDPTGFSFVDLSADRSGFTIARAATAPADAARVAARLAAASAQDILPISLLARQERLDNAAFVRAYGSIDDPRYAAMVARIDAVLARDAIH